MSSNAIQVLLPVGRIIQGDLYEPQVKDKAGNALTIKSGPNAGKPTQRYFFSVAIKKNPGEGHWASTPWGAQIWQKGHADWPQMIDRTQGMIMSKSFAWKVDDGDSTEYDESTPPKRLCDKPNYPGHWIVKLSSTYPPKIYTSDGSQPIVEPGYVKRGYWVEVLTTVEGNGQVSKPGIYVNHSLVAYRSGTATDEIRSGPNAAAVGFGKSALPPGVSATPVGNGAAFPALPGATPGLPGAPQPGGQPAQAVVTPGAPGFPAGAPAPGTALAPGGAPAGFPNAGTAAPSPSNGAPVAVQPNPGFLQPQTALPVPGLPAAPTGPKISPALAAAGHTLESLLAPSTGWTLDTARAAGHVIG